MYCSSCYREFVCLCYNEFLIKHADTLSKHNLHTMLVVHEQHLKETHISKQETIPVLHAYYKYSITIFTFTSSCVYTNMFKILRMFYMNNRKVMFYLNEVPVHNF